MNDSLCTCTGPDVIYADSSIPTAISRYGDYLEGVYSRSSVSSDGKFPPTPSKTYVNLAVVEHASQIRDLEEVRKNTLHGKVEEMCCGKTRFEIADILKPQDNGNPVSLVFIEGPPGMGKSTLAWELCRKWDRKQYDLAVLLRLRERKVQRIKKTANLFPHVDRDLRKSVAKDVLAREGKGVLFILDGYDELPVDLRHTSILLKLIKGEVFPKCSVLVTSRPSATKDLYTTCRPEIQRHVEILGFTQECVERYASSVFSSEPEVLEDFLIYISASKNPAINSLMYIPLNAAIVVEIYRSSKKKDSPIPKTLTQVYSQLCLTLLQRHLDSINPPNTLSTIKKFSDLPSTYYAHFKTLSQIAFEQYVQHRVVFDSDNVSEELVHFGFLDSVPALYGGGEVSYNFLHLTLQEFLAAYHITQLSNGIDVFEHHSEDERWEVVWRFVSGLTGFEYFKDKIKCSAFVRSTENNIEVKDLLLHCLFESQFIVDIFGIETFSYCSCQTYCQVDFSVPFYIIGSDDVVDACSSFSLLNRYVLGYCVANSSSTITWKVRIESGSDVSFLWGLKSNHHDNNGSFIHLEIVDVLPLFLRDYPVQVLQRIVHLSINSYKSFLVQLLPQMKSLNSLRMCMPPERDPNLFRIILHSGITKLVLNGLKYCFTSEGQRDSFIADLTDLICSQGSKLKDLTISKWSDDPQLFCDTVFKQLSSLNKLSLYLTSCYSLLWGDCFNLLETNTCLTSVHLISSHWYPLLPFSEVLRSNKTIQNIFIEMEFYWSHPEFADEPHWIEELEDVKKFNEALFLNTTLKEFTVHLIPVGWQICTNIRNDVIPDPRFHVKELHHY